METNEVNGVWAQFDQTMGEYFEKTNSKLKIKDLDLTSTCEAKAKVFLEWYAELFDCYLRSKIKFSEYKDKYPPLQYYSYAFNMFQVFPEGPKDFIAILATLMAEVYEVPNDIRSLFIHFNCLSAVYQYGAKGNWIPLEVVYKLDVASIKLLPVVGMYRGSIPGVFGKSRHMEGLLKANQQQKRKTIDKILKVYKEIGAQWCSDEPQKKPILFNGDRISRNNLAQVIAIQMKTEGFTKEHIYKCLKELHEKKEI